VLERAGLVSREVRGREHWLSLRPGSLAGAEAWIAEQTAFWQQSADRLAEQLDRGERR
jgi:hypothetical protein